MNRRDTILALLALAATPWPLRAGAQAPRRVGVVTAGGWDRDARSGIALRGALRERGWHEGRDYVCEARSWREAAQVPALVREPLQLKVEVIVAVSPQSIDGARSVTESVPIVMVNAADPVALGLVPSLNRPGGNLTGLAWDHGFESTTKQLQLLRETLPRMRRVALLWDAADRVHAVYLKHLEAAAGRLGLAIVSAGVRGPADLEAAFAQMRKERADALIAYPSAVLLPHREAVMALASRDRLPTLVQPGLGYPDTLLAWGPNTADNPPRVARYVDQILKGARPGDLPIEQPTKFNLAVNLRTARALGLTIPPSVLLRADQVIQ